MKNLKDVLQLLKVPFFSFSEDKLSPNLFVTKKRLFIIKCHSMTLPCNHMIKCHSMTLPGKHMITCKNITCILYIYINIKQKISARKKCSSIIAQYMSTLLGLIVKGGGFL